MDGELVSVEGTGLEAPADWDDLESPETLSRIRRRQSGSPRPAARPRTSAQAYSVPEALGRNQWALAGEWTIHRQSVDLHEAGGRLAYRFHARDVHLVMAPPKGEASARFRVLIDGRAARRFARRRRRRGGERRPVRAAAPPARPSARRRRRTGRSRSSSSIPASRSTRSRSARAVNRTPRRLVAPLRASPVAGSMDGDETRNRHRDVPLRHPVRGRPAGPGGARPLPEARCAREGRRASEPAPATAPRPSRRDRVALRQSRAARPCSRESGSPRRRRTSPRRQRPPRAPRGRPPRARAGSAPTLAQPGSDPPG